MKHAGLTPGRYPKINLGSVATMGTVRPACLGYETHTKQPGCYHCHPTPKHHMYDNSNHMIIRQHKGRGEQAPEFVRRQLALTE